MAPPEPARKELLAEIELLRARLREVEEKARRADGDRRRPPHPNGPSESGAAAPLSDDENTLLRIMLNTPYDSILILSTDMRILHINEAGAARLGSTPDGLIGKDVKDILPPDVAAHRGKIVEQVLESGAPVSYEDAREDYIFSHTLYPVFDGKDRVKAIVVCARDITEWKTTETALRLARERAEQYLDLAEVILVGLDEQERVILINRKGCEVLGGAREEILGEKWFDRFLPSEQTESVKRDFHRILSGELVPFEEYRNPVVRLNGEERLIEWRNSLLRDRAGKIIGTLSSGQDVTERVKAERALLESEERFRALFEHSTLAVLLETTDGRIETANPAACELFGYEPEEWADIRVADLTDEAGGAIMDDLVARRDTPSPISVEIIGRRKEGSLFPMEVRSFHADVAGRTTVFAFLQSIAERKEAEYRLRESEELYRGLMEHAGPGIGYWDLDGRCILMNRAAAAHWNSEPEAIIGRNMRDIFPKEDADLFLSLIRRVAESRKPYSFEHRMDLPTGTKWFLSVYTAVKDDAGGIQGVQIIANDITEQKNTEMEVQRLNETLESAQKIAKVGNWHYDIATGETIWSKQVFAITGWDKNKPVPSIAEHESFIHPEDWNRFTGDVENCSRGVPFEEVYRVVHPDGSIHYMHSHAYPVRDDEGDVAGLFGTCQDITEEKKAEEALRESEEKFRLLIERATVGVYVLREGNLIYVNPALAEMLGYDQEEMTGDLHISEVIHPDDIDLAMKEIRLRVAGDTGRGNVYFKAIRKDGSIIEIDVSGTPIDYGGEPSLMGTVVDVTERLAAERALQQSEERFRTIFENAADAMVIHDLETGRLLEVNEEAVQRWGYARDELRRMTPADLDERSNAAEVAERLRRLREKGRAVFETVLVSKDGKAIPTEVSARVVEFSGVRRLFTVNRDLTERKNAEREIEDRRLEVEQILQALPEALVYADTDRRIRRVNPAFEHIFGYEPEEVFGEKTEIIYADPEDFGAQGQRRYNTDAGPMYEPYEIRHRRKDGEVFPAEVVGTPVRNAAGEAIGFLGLVRDVTERKKAEEAIRNALEEIRWLKEQVEAENIFLREEVRHAHQRGEIVGRSEAIQSVLSQAEQVAPTDSTVLLLGETGTGKELLARAIHDMSPRRERPLVVVNCAAIPESLVESELFGHEKGAFTGALSRRVGRIEVADGSTLFLDEVGDLPAETQAKLLRVIQEGRFEKVGSDRTIEVDVRLLAATNHDLEQDVQERRFREDLFYRLNVFPITLPPLRDRKEDIEPLVWTFVGQIAEKMGKRIESVSRRSLEALMSYPWPGNVRELRNVIERAVIQAKGTTLHVDIPARRATDPLRKRTLSDLEKEHIREVLEVCGWRVRGEKGAAETLGLKPTTLEARMKKLGITRPGRS